MYTLTVSIYLRRIVVLLLGWSIFVLLARWECGFVWQINEPLCNNIISEPTRRRKGWSAEKKRSLNLLIKKPKDKFAWNEEKNCWIYAYLNTYVNIYAHTNTQIYTYNVCVRIWYMYTHIRSTTKAQKFFEEGILIKEHRFFF